MRFFRPPTQDQAGVLIGVMAALFGAWVRLLIPGMAGFPMNDGGLFYVMVHDLQANGLRIPLYVQYNGLTIPFAYPPLGFYAGGIASNVLHLDVIRVLQWLPAVVLIAALPAFYLLAKTILGSSFLAGLATLLFAFTPRAITWQIMGGGLTRSFGQLFLLLALAFIYEAFAHYTRTRLLLAMLFSSLVVLSHPEAALQAVGIAILLWIFVGRSRQSAAHAAVIGAGTLTITAIWWLPAIAHYGVGTLLSAGQTGQHSLLALLEPFVVNLAEEPLTTMVAVLGIVGFAILLSRRSLLVPIWFFAPFLIDPRNALTNAMIPLDLLAAVALAGAILPALARTASGQPQAPGIHLWQARPAVLFLTFSGLYMLGQTAYFGTQLARTALSPDSRIAFQWIRTNTTAGSRFLLVTGGAEPFCDSTLEWFPALADRQSVTTIQGREWVDGRDFGRFIATAHSTAGCLSADSPLACIESVASAPQSQLIFDYIYVARRTPLVSSCRVLGVSGETGRLIGELAHAPAYTQVYSGEDEVVFRRR
ncbi:MAG TPA: hypothetical protein VF784_15640 [Anaerolineales bacterium]